MKKRIFYPIWKLEEVERQLSDMERQGWRLHKLLGLYGFEFVSAQPKEVQYFITYSICRGPRMWDLEHDIKSKFNANPISNVFHPMRQIEIFRITQPSDLQETREQRNRDMCTMMRYNLGVCALYLVLALALLLLVLQAWPLAILFGALLAVGVAGVTYYLIAWWIFKKRTGGRTE